MVLVYKLNAYLFRMDFVCNMLSAMFTSILREMHYLLEVYLGTRK